MQPNTIDSTMPSEKTITEAPKKEKQSLRNRIDNPRDSWWMVWYFQIPI